MTPITKIANKGDVRRGRRWIREEKRGTIWEIFDSKRSMISRSSKFLGFRFYVSEEKEESHTMRPWWVQRHNLFPRSVGQKTEILNKTKEQSVEQQEVLKLLLFP
jgi:hypothetical protein